MLTVSLAPARWLVLAFSLAAIASVAIVVCYGLEDYAVQLVPGFAAALLAFMIALAWERDREEKGVVREANDLITQRKGEAERRLGTIRRELETNLVSLREAKRFLPLHIVAVNPQLLAGAWSASASALAELLEDVDLTAEIAFTYDRLEELRWRLRTRAESRTNDLDQMSIALVAELIPRRRRSSSGSASRSKTRECNCAV